MSDTLALLADMVGDLEKTRIANENRYRTLTRAVADEDGGVRGLGLAETNPVVVHVGVLVDSITKLEGQAIKALQSFTRQEPLWKAWAKDQTGIGEKQFARLLSTLGSAPDWNDLHERPRTVGELWAFAGHGGESKRKRGFKSNWSTQAKTRTYLIAESCMKTGKATNSTFRQVYDKRKENTVGRLHATACVRCGPSGKPAQPGSPWSDGHRHADALRITGKEILRDLWIAARAQRTLDDHATTEAQSRTVVE